MNGNENVYWRLSWATARLAEDLTRFSAVFISAFPSLYDWYVEDFGGSEATVLAHLGRYAAPGLRRRLESVEDIAGYRYDWDLNEAAGKVLR